MKAGGEINMPSTKVPWYSLSISSEHLHATTRPREAGWMNQVTDNRKEGAGVKNVPFGYPVCCVWLFYF